MMIEREEELRRNCFLEIMSASVYYRKNEYVSTCVVLLQLLLLLLLLYARVPEHYQKQCGEQIMVFLFLHSTHSSSPRLLSLSLSLSLSPTYLEETKNIISGKSGKQSQLCHHPFPIRGEPSSVQLA